MPPPDHFRNAGQAGKSLSGILKPSIGIYPMVPLQARGRAKVIRERAAAVVGNEAGHEQGKAGSMEERKWRKGYEKI
jgi:hypothetical protein